MNGDVGRARPPVLFPNHGPDPCRQGSLCTIGQRIRDGECLVVAVETVLWFPRSDGRVVCVHGSGSFHRRLEENRWVPVAPSRTPGVACATAAPGVDQCLDGVSVVHVPWGIAPSERQYRADDARRLVGLMKEG